MRIVLKAGTAATQETVLCDGATREIGKASGPDNLRLPLGFLVQMDPLIRATSPSILARGNGMMDISFNVTRRFDDYESAVQWHLTHLKTVPTGTLLIFDFTTQQFQITPVALERIEHNPPLDATLRLAYHFKGARPS